MTRRRAKVETAIFRPCATERATPRAVLRFLKEVMSSLAERPRELDVILDFREAGEIGAMSLDLVGGEPVISQTGRLSAHGRFNRRWLAEHPVPLSISPLIRLRFVPTSASRLRVSSKLTGCWPLWVHLCQASFLLAARGCKLSLR